MQLILYILIIGIKKIKYMAPGWATEESTEEEISNYINNQIEQAKNSIPSGKGLIYCEDCDEEIPEARRKAVPGVRRCVKCQEKRDKLNRK